MTLNLTLEDFDSYSDFWEWSFWNKWSEAERDAWYAKWTALGIPRDEVEPRPVKRRKRRTPASVLVEEAEWFLGAGSSPFELVRQLEMSVGAAEQALRRAGRHDLARWVASGVYERESA